MQLLHSAAIFKSTVARPGGRRIERGVRRDFTKLALKVALAARAAGITSFQMYMSEVLLSVIFAGVLEHRPSIKLVIGEAGTGWIPYILQRMYAEWEDQFQQLDLKLPPSEKWRRQCYGTAIRATRSA
jgi:uncharacterized protein